MEIQKHIEFEFNSDPIILSEIENILLDIKDKLNLNEEKYYSILVAITEAINNSIIHAHQNNKSKLIKFIIEIDEKGIKFIILDQGSGFEPSKVEDPRNANNILKPGGRGVFLINQLSKSNRYTKLESGMKLEIYFDIN